VLEPGRGRWWLFLRQRRRFGNLLEIRIERGLQLGVIGEHQTVRCKGAALTPPVAVVEDANDEPVPDFHRSNLLLV
jgi:hypothetical protein